MAPQDGENDEQGLTKEQAAIYDRQIRLWGVDAQSRMSKARVVCAGRILSALGNEVLKNVCLAGVGTIVLCSSDEKNFSFLGQTVQEMADELARMNTFVKLETIKEDELLESAKHANAVCVVGIGALQAPADLARTCVECGGGFFVSECIGLVGAMFLDLGLYKFTEESRDMDDVSQATVTVDREVQFAPYSEKVDDNGRLKKVAGPASAMLNGLLDVRSGEISSTHFVERVQSACTDLGVRKRLIPKEQRLSQLAAAVAADIAPVAGVVGGICGREVVKFLTGKDEPINNFFFYDAIRSAGVVEMS